MHFLTDKGSAFFVIPAEKIRTLFRGSCANDDSVLTKIENTQGNSNLPIFRFQPQIIAIWTNSDGILIW